MGGVQGDIKEYIYSFLVDASLTVNTIEKSKSLLEAILRDPSHPL